MALGRNLQPVVSSVGGATVRVGTFDTTGAFELGDLFVEPPAMLLKDTASSLEAVEVLG